MLKRSITYDDYNGNSVTEDFYFNFTKLELIELDVKFDGGLEGQIKRLTNTQNGKDAYYMFKDIVLSAYGIKSEDGKRFVKTPEITADFEASPALAELIIGFLENPQDGASFLEACLPAKLVEAAKNAAADKASEKSPKVDPVVASLPAMYPVLNEDPKGSPEAEDDQISYRALQDMSREELIAKFQKRLEDKPE